MDTQTPAYGLWTIVFFNTALFILFAFSFSRPQSKRDWRAFGAFSAFIVALFAEMYGFPLTIYLLSGWLGSRYPSLDLFSHNAGHLLEDLLGWQGDPHFAPPHLLSSVLIGGGFILVAAAWHVLYTAQREHQLALTGPYGWVRHPQYVGFVLILLGFLLQWPTLITLLMFPILVVMYVRLARREERDATVAFGSAYVAYTAVTPAFFPRLNGLKPRQPERADKIKDQGEADMSDRCHIDPIEKTVTAEELETTATAYLSIFGMGCPQCAVRVRNSLLALYGVCDVSVDHLTGVGRIVFAPNVTTIPAIVDAIGHAGNDGRHEYLAVPLGQLSNA